MNSGSSIVLQLLITVPVTTAAAVNTRRAPIHITAEFVYAKKVTPAVEKSAKVRFDQPLQLQQSCNYIDAKYIENAIIYRYSWKMNLHDGDACRHIVLCNKIY